LGMPPPVTATAKAVPFIDVTDDYERSVRMILKSKRLTSQAVPP
jgi:hypothetical protein